MLHHEPRRSSTQAPKECQRIRINSKVALAEKMGRHVGRRQLYLPLGACVGILGALHPHYLASGIACVRSALLNVFRANAIAMTLRKTLGRVVAW